MSDEYNKRNAEIYVSMKNLFEFHLTKLVGEVKNDQDYSKTFNLLVSTFNNMADDSKKLTDKPSTSL